jgi:hypothetical protein
MRSVVLLLLCVLWACDPGSDELPEAMPASSKKQLEAPRAEPRELLPHERILDDWSRDAKVVAVVEIAAMRSFEIEYPPFVATEFQLTSLRALRGTLPPKVVIRGGRRKDGGVVVDVEAPPLAEGGTYLAFFQTAGDGLVIRNATRLQGADRARIYGHLWSVAEVNSFIQAKHGGSR